MPRPVRLLPLLAFTFLAACSRPQPAAPVVSAQLDAQDAAQASQPQATELRDTIQKPINRAKSVEDIVAKGNQNHNAEGDAAATGADSPAASQ